MTSTAETLPSHFYYDEDHFVKELDAFWYREWICVGRMTGLREPGDYQRIDCLDQSVIVVRDKQGQIRAYHNTCRHRGSLICEAAKGHFHQGRIVCPYHAWTYGLDGVLERTPWRLPSDDFAYEDFSLYRVGALEWAGYVFLNFSVEGDVDRESVLSSLVGKFTNWSLEDARTVHQMEVVLACNWKVFWENFQECYHCPNVHPELCRVVPTYGLGYSSPTENPDHVESTDSTSRLAPGAETWTIDGKSHLPLFQGLTEEERRLGHLFGVTLPSGYFVGHIDYFRSVRMMPLSSEQTRLNIDWLVPETGDELTPEAIEHMISLSALVVEQDGRACELNQRGLRSRRHKKGVLVTQEQHIVDFHRWIREGLANLSGP